MNVNNRDRKLIAKYRLGMSMREVADEFGISFERVRQILRRKAPKLIRRVGDTRNNSTGKASRCANFAML